jgi:serine/threonine protein kinase/tetratricopeptide (TPR) repeat protein
MPKQTDPSRDLLFGLLALQNGLIDQGALFTAFAAWTRDKGQTLADHLIELGHLDAPRRAVVEAIAGLHVQALGGDPEKSLAVLAVGPATRESLVRAGGPDLEATLGHVSSVRGSTHDDDVPDRTGSYSVGSATSLGQRFRILRPHARGGLGAVFVALDSELDREVALKQILDDRADDPTSRFRFLIEAQITGGLEHPGIVPVYGLGSYGDGRPYYAMRFIRGDSLKEAIDVFHGRTHIKLSQHVCNSPPLGEGSGVKGGLPEEATRARSGSRDLALRKLLRRFMDVCNAIDYAHSRGVIHRDIKPANIIVGKHGETLVVDWGLAKPTGRALPGTDSGERLLMPSSASGSSDTLLGSALGTPAYMSPEQADGQLERLGPPSDVYSLGATLYCLLTGKPPFGGEALDVIRAVQRGEFPPPRQLNPSIDLALEAICLKAMAHRPEDRYTSCRALADDLDRWMADEPVSAWREPFSRRARRWARRNRTAATAAAGALVAGVIGLSAVLAVQTRAKADLAASLSRETNARTALASTNADLTRSQAAVQARYDLAVDAIRTFHTGVSEDFLLKQEQFKDVRDRLLKSASDFYGKLGALLGKETDLASRRAVGEANYEVAELTSKVGKPDDALAAHQQVVAARTRLAAESPDDPAIKADLGRSLTAVGGLLEITGRTGEAELTYRKAESLLVELVTTIAEAAAVRGVLANCRSRLGSLLHSTGRDDEALSVYRLARADQQALAAAPGATAESRRDLSDTISRVARALEATGKSAEAAAEYREALAIQQLLADNNPAVTDFQSRLASSHTDLGNLLRNTGKQSAAAAEFREALAVQQKLAEFNPAVTQFRNSLANSHNSLGYLLSNSGKLSEAESEYRKALAVQQKLADDNAAVTQFRNSLALIHNNLGWLLYQTGKAVEAVAEYRKALAIQQKLADDNPAIPVFQRNLANSLLGIGWQLAQADKMDDAIGYYTREEAIRLKLAQGNSATPESRDYLANCQTNTADVLRRAGRLSEALAACDRSLAVRTPLAAAHPEVPSYGAGLGETYLRLGQVRYDMADPAGAADAWKRACANYERSNPLSGEQTFFQACCHAGLAGLAGRPGSGVSATQGADEAGKAMAVVRRAIAMGYRNPDTYQTEVALDTLRDRPDFRALLMDLMMPTEPFAR